MNYVHQLNKIYWEKSISNGNEKEGKKVIVIPQNLKLTVTVSSQRPEGDRDKEMCKEIYFQIVLRKYPHVHKHIHD